MPVARISRSRESGRFMGVNIKKAPQLASLRSFLKEISRDGSVRTRLGEDHAVTRLEPDTRGKALEIDLSDRLGGLDG